MAKELALKYGCNPNQKPARIFMQEGELPIEVLNGRPGYINFMDALNGWQDVYKRQALACAVDVSVTEYHFITGLAVRMKEEACFGAGLCEGFSGEPEILVFFVVEELPAFCNDRVCRVKRRCPVIPLVKWLGRTAPATACQGC